MGAEFSRFPLSMTTLTDAELLDSLKTRQPEALGQLYDRYCSVVYRVALKMLQSQPEAEDPTQDIFLSVWRRPVAPTKHDHLQATLDRVTHHLNSVAPAVYLRSTILVKVTTPSSRSQRKRVEMTVTFGGNDSYKLCLTTDYSCRFNTPLRRLR